MTVAVGTARTGSVPLATFTCWQCGACCRVPGDVRIDEGETVAMARHLGLSLASFTAQYTCLRPDRRGLILREQADGACILLKADGDCAVQAVKPQQCRDFPYRWNYPGWETRCQSQCAWPRAAHDRPVVDAGTTPAPMARRVADATEEPKCG